MASWLRSLDYGSEASITDPYTQSVAVFRAVNVVGDALSRAPIRLYRQEQWVQEGRVYELLENPNPHMRQSAFVKVVAAHQLLYGNAYIYLDEPDSVGVPRSLLPLPPGQVAPERDKGNAYSLKGYRYSGGNSKHDVLIPSDRIIHLQYAPNPSDPMVGISPMDVASMTIQSDNLASVWNKAVLENSGSPAGLLKWRGEGRFDEADARLVKDQWQATYGGANNAESIAVLGSNFDWQTIGVSPKDMQWLEARRWNLGDIARAFNVPLVFLNEYESAGLSDAGLKIQAKLLYTNNVIPMAVSFGQMLTERVVSPRDPSMNAVFDFDAVEALGEDLTEKLEHAKRLSDLGFPLNAINEKLELGMDPVEWGDTNLVNAGLIPVQDLISFSDFELDEIEDDSTEVEETEVDESAPESSEDAPEATSDSGPRDFTGVQMSTALEIVTKVGLGELPRDSAVGLLKTLFGFTDAEAEMMLGSSKPEAETTEVIEVEEEDVVEEISAVREKISVASFISENAARGLKYHNEGLSGGGMRPHTIREANDMAAGYVTEDKLRRMSAWFSRHLSDLDAPKNSNPNHDDYPGPGAVAWLLWGGNPTSDPMRAKDWCDRKIASLDQSAELAHDHLGLVVQSVVLSREVFASEEDAVAFAESEGIARSSVEHCESSWRIRQASPDKFVPGSLRAIAQDGGRVVVKGRLVADYYDSEGNWRLPHWRMEQHKIHDKRRRPYEKEMQSKVSRVFHELRRDILAGLEDGVEDTEGRSIDGSNKRAKIDWLLNPRAISNALNAIDPEKTPRKFKQVVEKAVTAGSKAAIGNAKEYGITLGDSTTIKDYESKLPQLATNYWDSRAGEFVKIFKTTKQRIAKTLSASMQNGESLGSAIERVKTVFKNGNHGLSTGRARTIARTEIGIATSIGEWETYTAIGVKQVEWLSAGDSAVRRSHQIDGEIRKMGQRFSNGLTRPLDRSGKPGEVINCRCDLLPVEGTIV